MTEEVLTCHMESSLKRDIREIAEDNDQSISEFVRGILKAEVAEQKRHDVVREAKAAEKLERIIAQGKDEIKAEIDKFNRSATAVQSLTARAGVYTIANHELLKQEYSQTMRNDARSTGVRRLRKDILSELELDLDPEEIPEIADNGSNKPWADENDDNDDNE